MLSLMTEKLWIHEKVRLVLTFFPTSETSFTRHWHEKRRLSWPVGRWESEEMLGCVVKVKKKWGNARPCCKNRKNSTLRVERQQRVNAQRASSSSHEADAGVRTRGRRPRILTARDNFQSRSPSAKCCELYASLHDRFRLEVRILFYPMRTLKLVAWVTSFIAGMRWWAGRGREYRWMEARGSGAQLLWGPGAKPQRAVREAEPPECHETDLKCFIN